MKTGKHPPRKREAGRGSVLLRGQSFLGLRTRRAGAF